MTRLLSEVRDYLRRDRLRILMYHSILDAPGDRNAIHPEAFAAQLQYLADRKFQVVSLQAACELLAARRAVRRHIVLTFDDGYQDFLTTALPLLRQHHFTATLFVVTGLSGQTSLWSSTDKARRLLALDELKQVQSLGFSLGSHTVTHPDLVALDGAALQAELARSRAHLAELGERFIPLAYPGGRFTARERDAVARAGYACGVIVSGRWGNGPETDLFLLKREPVLATDSLRWFAHRVEGWYEGYYLGARARGLQTR